MKHLKLLGLAALAIAALTAYASTGTASANTVLCETTVTSGCGSAWDWGPGDVLEFSLASGGTTRWTDTSGFFTYATCTGGTFEAELSTTTTPKGSVSAANVLWSGCSKTPETLTGGELEVHHISGTHNGTVTANGLAVTILDPWGKKCTYGFSNARDIGTLVTSANGTDAQININVGLDLYPIHSDGLCASSAKWIASYTQTTHTVLYVSAG